MATYKQSPKGVIVADSAIGINMDDWQSQSYDDLVGNLKRDLALDVSVDVQPGSYQKALLATSRPTASVNIAIPAFTMGAGATWYFGNGNAQTRFTTGGMKIVNTGDGEGWYIQVPVTGVYRANAYARCDASTAAWGYIQIEGIVNGTNSSAYGYAIDHNYNTQSAVYAEPNFSRLIYLKAGDRFNVWVNNDQIQTIQFGSYELEWASAMNPTDALLVNP